MRVKKKKWSDFGGELLGTSLQSLMITCEGERRQEKKKTLFSVQRANATGVKNKISTVSSGSEGKAMVRQWGEKVVAGLGGVCGVGKPQCSAVARGGVGGEMGNITSTRMTRAGREKETGGEKRRVLSSKKTCEEEKGKFNR